MGSATGVGLTGVGLCGIHLTSRNHYSTTFGLRNSRKFTGANIGRLSAYS